MIKEVIERIAYCKNHDFNKLYELCSELLEEGHIHNNCYAIAFAHIHLADYHILQRNHVACFQHLHEGLAIAEHNDYRELLLHGYTIGGMYYHAQFDEISSITYYIDALAYAKELQLPQEAMVVLNNMAAMFSARHDYPEALHYLKMAYQEFQNNNHEQYTQRDLIMISNLVQMYIFTNQQKEAHAVFQEHKDAFDHLQYEEFSQQIMKLCKLYLANADHNMTIVEDITDYFIQGAFYKQQNRNLYFSYYQDMFTIMLEHLDKHRCETLLQQMGELCRKDDIEQQCALHLNWIHFAEKFHLEEKLISAYKQYYLLQKLVNDVTDRAKAERMKQKIIMNEMIKEREVMEHEKRILETRVKIDGLTHLFNRAYFTQIAQNLSKNEDVKTLSFILVDIDYFKEYNDVYGHCQGDQLLQKIACCLDETGDNRFFAARYGGDEFVCLCVNVTDDIIQTYLQSVYDQIREQAIEHKQSKVAPIASISTGYATFPIDADYHLEKALIITDTTLHRAKQQGRNCFLAYEPNHHS